MKMNFRIDRLTNNGIVGYLNEEEIRRFCSLADNNRESATRMANETLRRSKHINTIVVSRMTK
ncbi:MAG: hypothetical protein U0K95_02595 [Eubacterium sp.]|nr:hypothetical protein [Eubacterium sp.]